MPSIREPDETEQAHEILEGVFRAAEIKSVPENATLREDYLVAKRLVLDGVVTLDQVIQNLKAGYTEEPPRIGRSAAGFPCFHSTGLAINSEMVREAEEELGRIDANPEAFYKQQLEISREQAEKEDTKAALEEMIRLSVGAISPPKV